MTRVWPEIPELVALYDIECAGRWDYDFYLQLAASLEVDTVVDIGCGTGVLATDLAQSGLRVIGVDPAEPILEVARQRRAGEQVEWIHGVADDVPGAAADLAIMTGHVAQYFVEDQQWSNVLGQIHRILRPEGWLAFETRNPVHRWDQEWTRDRSSATYGHPDGGTFTSWVQVVDKSGDTDSYVQTHEGNTILPNGNHLRALESLRFRSEAEILNSLTEAGFALDTAWGDWQRSPFTPESRELIVLARRS
jgi:ubiquinone/menaquinone biosynthesis C-methylase UbiE